MTHIKHMRKILSFNKARQGRQQGFSILELVATLGLMSVVSLIAVNNLKQLDDPVRNASAEITGFFKQVRARAIATTSAYTITPSGSGNLVTVYSNNCASASTTSDNQVVLELSSGASLTDTSWSVCVNSRGMPDSNLLISVTGDSGTRTLEIFLGGAIKEVENVA